MNETATTPVLATQSRIGSPQQTIHVLWDDVSVIFSELLTGLLGREIEASAEREDFYYWYIHLPDTSLSRQELHALFAFAGAEDIDLEQNDYGEYPILELFQELCSKILSKYLPFQLERTRADDEGIWFIGAAAGQASLTIGLPDRTSLVADTWNDLDYPGIRISLKNTDGTEDYLCFAEYNTSKPDGRRLHICAYTRDLEEPAYYECYNDPGSPSPNV